MKDKYPFREKGRPIVVECKDGISLVSYGIDYSTLKGQSPEKAKVISSNCNSRILINNKSESD